MATTYTETEVKKVSLHFRDWAQFDREYHFLSVVDGKIKTLADLRIYHSSTYHTYYAALWIHGDRWRTGGGKADGYGYDLASTAAYNATCCAGIKPTVEFDGRGMEYACEQLKAIIAEYFDVDNIDVIYSHA